MVAPSVPAATTSSAGHAAPHSGQKRPGAATSRLQDGQTGMEREGTPLEDARDRENCATTQSDLSNDRGTKSREVFLNGREREAAMRSGDDAVG